MLSSLRVAATRRLGAALAAFLLLSFGLAGAVSGATVAKVQLSPGWATFGVALPAGAARAGLKLSGLTTQTDVKTTWPDGSIRFAVVTAKVPTAGQYDVLESSLEPGTFVPSAWPGRTSVQFTIGGVLWTASLPTNPSADVWLSGPLVHEARVVITPESGGTAHEYLRVYADVRSYADGAQRVDFTAENALDKAGADVIQYDVVVVVNGARVYSKARRPGPSTCSSVAGGYDRVTSANHGIQMGEVVKITSGPYAGENRFVANVIDQNTFELQPSLGGNMAAGTTWEDPGVLHRYMARWRKVFWSAGSGATVLPDVSAWVAAKAVPVYRADLPADETHDLGLRRYDIMNVGDFWHYMDDHGGRPEIAIVSAWVAKFLVHPSVAAAEYINRTHGDLAGSWNAHVRRADGSLPLVTDAPYDYWINQQWRANGWHGPQGNLAGLSGVAQVGNSNLGWNLADNAHQPSFAYIPYLMTGDRYYLDEMVFWANYAILATYPGQGLAYRGARGEGYLKFPGNQVRGSAWTFRNVVDIAAYAPDAHPLRSYFRQVAVNNLADFDAYADAAATTRPLGSSFETGDDYAYSPTTNLRYFRSNVMEGDFLALAIDHANEVGFTGGTRLRDRLLRWHLKLFQSAPDYPITYNSPYKLNVAEQGADGQLRFYTSMAKVFTETFGQPPSPVPDHELYEYWTYASLVLGKKHGVAGAQAALDYLWPTVGSQFVAVPYKGGWAFPKPDANSPAPPQHPRILQ